MQHRVLHSIIVFPRWHENQSRPSQFYLSFCTKTQIGKDDLDIYCRKCINYEGNYKLKNFNMKPDNSGEGSLVGSRAHEREPREVSLQELRTEEDYPLYYALLPNLKALRLDHGEVNQAKSDFGVLAGHFPDELRALEGKSLKEVREKLEKLQNLLEQRKAA